MLIIFWRGGRSMRRDEMFFLSGGESGYLFVGEMVFLVGGDGFWRDFWSKGGFLSVGEGVCLSVGLSLLIGGVCVFLSVGESGFWIEGIERIELVIEKGKRGI